MARKRPSIDSSDAICSSLLDIMWLIGRCVTPVAWVQGLGLAPLCDYNAGAADRLDPVRSYNAHPTGPSSDRCSSSTQISIASWAAGGGFIAACTRSPCRFTRAHLAPSCTSYADKPPKRHGDELLAWHHAGTALARQHHHDAARR